MLLGHEELLLGHLNSASELFDEAYKISKRLTEHDEDNFRWQRAHLVYAIGRSRVAAARGDLSAALGTIDIAIDEIRELSNNTPSKIEQRRFVITRVLAQRAKVLRQANDARTPDAIKEALASVDLAENSRSVFLVAGLQLLVGDLHAEAGDQSEATAAWLAGLESINVRLDKSRELIVLLTEAELLDRTKSAALASELRTEIAKRGFRDTDDRALTRALIGVLF